MLPLTLILNSSAMRIPPASPPLTLPCSRSTAFEARARFGQLGSLRAQTRSAPSPACGGGVGWGKARSNLRVCPHPNPPPLAGEGTHRVCCAVVHQFQRNTLLAEPAACEQAAL